MDEKKRIKLLAGATGVALLGLVYMYSGDIMSMFSSEETSEISSLQTNASARPVPVTKNTKKAELQKDVSVKSELKQAEIVSSAAKHINITERENAVKNSTSIGELSELKNQANIYKAKAEMMREQVLFETEKQKLLALLNPPKAETKEVAPETSKENNVESELLKLIESQRNELNKVKNNQNYQPVQTAQKPERTVSQQPVSGPAAEMPILPEFGGVSILSTQKINGMYSAVVSVDGRRMKVKKGDMIDNDKVLSISKNEIRMRSGKKYEF